ncbi:MAG TPA: UDP-N-acetylglucosamine 1-carboxyvinyltransferase [Leptolyngbya sp.]|jgi:UDP-N-acetylglucosamine 1-carboxyvinyltransferase|nr:UDP-N-acetylglucosamine 1-carboxyvinyltransferase [Leptolyngbya sp.]
MPTQEDKAITLAASLPNSQSSPEESHSVLHIWGKQPLSGHVNISGAKNSALVLMAGSILCSGTCRLRNVPSLLDITRIGEILTALGVKVSHSQGILDLDASEITQSKAPYDLVSQLRASFFVMGPLLARLGIAQVPLPGGCSIGDRPVDLHVKGLQALGAEVMIEHGVVNAYIRGNRKRLTGARIYLDFPSVGATENIMMAATLAEGETIIENAAQEPEVVDLANFCRAMGAQIRGAGTNRIVINGVPQLHETDYSVVPDRIEAGTFLLAGAITRSEISLSPVVPDHLSAAIAKLKEIGVRVAIDAPDRIRVLPADIIRGTDIETLPFPGFPTDLQAPFMSLLTLAEGDSVISETLFENRLQHVAELNRMGADIRLKGNIAIVRGVSQLSGAPVQGTDLRASAALVIAGLAAEGVTTVRGLNHLDRGYDNIEAKLRRLGAKIQRAQETDLAKAPAPLKAIG